MKKVRPYQEELIQETLKKYSEGYNSPCIVLGCGGGKSVITAEIAKRSTAKGNRVLFLVHRKELVDQIRNTFTWWGVDMNLCDIMMVQTLSRRLAKIQPDFYDFMIVDENHHALANTYKKIFEHFTCKRLGVTATPVRLNGDGLGDVNDVLVEGVSTEWLIENNFLAPYKYYAPQLVNTGKLHIKRGEFVNAEVDELLNDNIIWGDAIAHYEKLAKGKKTIVYCHSITASKAVASEFNNAGYKSAHIDANTPKKEREELIKAFATGDVTVLTNVDLFGEGLDVPNCECVILLRPTMSLTLHIQQSMRSMRYKQDKQAIIIDHVGNVYRHGLPDDKREWTLAKRDRKKTTADKNTVSIFSCEKCFGMSNRDEVKNRICPLCGHQQTVKERAEKQVDSGAELAEVEVAFEFKKPLTYNYWELDTLEKFQTYAEEKSYNPKWAYIKWNQYKKENNVI